MRMKKIGGLLVAGLLCFGLAACAESVPEPTEPPPEVKLQLSDVAVELTIGESHTTSSEVKVDGQLLEDAVLQWSSANEQIATVADGVITAQGAGTTTIQATCTYEGVEATDTIRVTVQKPTVALDLTAPVILDMSTSDSGLVSFALPEGVAKANEVLISGTEYRMISAGNQMMIDATHLAPGEYVMTVEQEKELISFPICVVTMVIRSAEDLKAATLREDAKTGYFVLGNNIDCSALTDPICFEERSWFETNLGNNRAGFLGGFNGMGYTIYNLKLAGNGLFGIIAASGVVRNVAFVNVQASEYVICKDSTGLISQVYVQGDFSHVLYGSYGPTNRLENIVAEATRADALVCQHVASVDTDGYNVVDLYGLIIVGRNAQVTGWSRTSEVSYLKMEAKFCAYSGMTKRSIPTVTEEDGFNSYWDISSGFPIFISAAQ